MRIVKKSQLREIEVGALCAGVDATLDAVVTETLQFHFLEEILFTN